MIATGSVLLTTTPWRPWTVVLLVGLLLANGFFVAAEIGLLAARRGRLEEAAASGDRRARRAVAALNDLSVTFTGAQLGITMCSLGLGFVAGPALVTLLEGGLALTGLAPVAVPVVAVIVALSLIVLLHLVVGEMAPKHLAIDRAETIALALARPLGWFVMLLRPLIVLCNGMAALLLRAVRVEPVDEHALVHTPDELALALAESQAQGTISDQDARVLDAALQLGNIDAEAAMTPRVDLHAVSDDASLDELLDLAAETGHTRLPVFHEDIDHIVGVVHVKDVLIRGVEERGRLAVQELMRPIPAVPETRDLEQLLHAMLDERSHAVLVLDEFGGTAGLLTLEDVLEELVGEIVDEFDQEPAAPPPRERVWSVPGTMRRDELARLTGLELTEGDTETVSGWIVEQLGRLPQRGDHVDAAGGWQLTVLQLQGRRAGDVEVRAPRA